MNQQTNIPIGFQNFIYEKKVKVDTSKVNAFWEKLNLRETFVDAQFFPFKVEFATGLKNGNFETGELNIHHGPLLSVHGLIGDISENYRDLNYFYGSYALSFRLVRPTRLEFFREEDGIRLKLHAFVKPWFIPLWRFGNNFFWNFFNVL